MSAYVAIVLILVPALATSGLLLVSSRLFTGIKHAQGVSTIWKESCNICKLRRKMYN